MGKSNSKWNNWQSINLQNTQQLNTRKMNNQIKTRAKELNRLFSKDVQMTNKHMKRCSISLNIQGSSIQSLSCVWLFATPWTAAHQASLSITNSQSPPKPMFIESVMPSNHIILYCPLLLLPSIFPSIRVFSNESALRIRWPKYCSFNFNISPSSEHSDWSLLGRTGWISLQSKGLPRVFPNSKFNNINSSALSFLYSPTLTSTHDHWKNIILD